MVKVKICGITQFGDAQLAVSLGAWAVGFIFYKKSPRYILPSRAREIIKSLPKKVIPVGVFVNAQESDIKRIAVYCGLKAIQFHGNEAPEFCAKFQGFNTIKAFRVGKDFDFSRVCEYPTSLYLFDTHQKGMYGGSGKTFDWNVLKEKKKINKPLILSGGLNARNIVAAVKRVKPFAVDVSSGVESSYGKKSEKLLQSFFNKIEQCKE
ncbi:MAG: phosphoribosylanthranilate isomerase [Candidatus Omnitrophota bacterium]